jgi:hypothetical protein
MSILAAAAVSIGFACLGGGVASAQVSPLPSLCTEDANNGCKVTLPVAGTTITVASDGEAVFDPFGFGADTSDGVQLDSNWVAQKGAWQNVWVNIGNNTWVLPACVGGVCENNRVFEPPATWVSATGQFNVPFFQWSMNEAGSGKVSDLITIGNFANGGSFVKFMSDVPEPASWTMLILGFGALGFAARRRARTLSA